MTHPIDNDPEFAKERCAFMLHDGEGLARWLVVVAASYFWCDFAIYEATGWEIDNESPLFRPKDWRGTGDERPWSNDSESTVSGFVKWDGCTEFEASSHFCDGAESYARMYEAIQFTMRNAHSLMIEVAALRGKEASMLWEPQGAASSPVYKAKPFELP